MKKIYFLFFTLIFYKIEFKKIKSGNTEPTH